MHVRVVQAGDDSSPTGVDYGGSRPATPQDLIDGACPLDLASFDGERLYERWSAIGGNLSVVDDEFGRHGSPLARLSRLP
jgi:hypothetical protein